uniref:leucine--tRNA ligase n=1 Tax=Timema californicum TaxID=61474 RepID=A0A7R9IZS2_TIMCA|nr:unnamed protein product [Timema californicum]
MSKSKHNGVDPDDMLKDYGIDTTRLLILADVSPTSHRHWTVDKVIAPEVIAPEVIAPEVVVPELIAPEVVM